MTKSYINIGLSFCITWFEGSIMTWLRRVGWFVFLIVLSCSISVIAAEGDEKVIVKDFNEIYYMEGTGSVDISTKITFIGDNLNNGDVPIEVKFYTTDWEILSSEEVDNNKVRTHVGMNGYDPVYEYHDYTGSFSFRTDATGDLEFRLIVNLGDTRGHNEVYTININPSSNPNNNPTTEEVFFTSTVIIILIVIIIVMTVAAGKVVMDRRELSSETSMDLEIGPTDTELDISMNDNVFKPVPEIRGTRVLKSQTSHSEMDMDEV